MDGTLNYNNRKVEKEVARIVGTFNMQDSSIDTIVSTFENYEMRNIRTENLSFQMSINPDPEAPGEKLSDKEVLSYAKKLMEELGYGNQPIAIYEHHDIKRTHYHVVSIRTNEKGKKISDYNEDYKAKRLLDKYAKEFHYTPAGMENTKKRQADMTESLRFDTQSGNVREQYTKLFDEGMKWHFTTFTQFQTIMKSMGIHVEPVEGDSWRIIMQGLDAKGNKTSLRISQEEIGREFYKEYESRARECKAEKTADKESRAEVAEIKKRIAKTIDICLRLSVSESHFERMLQRKGITVTLSRGADGSIFGSTFADSRSRLTFKGSELGKNITAEKFRRAEDKETGQWTRLEREREENNFQRAMDRAALISMEGPEPENLPDSEESLRDYETIALELLDEILNALPTRSRGVKKDVYGKKKKKKGKYIR